MAVFAIAESSGTISELIAFVVEQRGHTAIAGGVTRAWEQSPDALIADLGWAHGRALADRLRLRDPRLPIVCVSAWSPSAESRAYEPVAHVRMPFSVGELEAALEAALRHRPVQ